MRSKPDPVDQPERTAHYDSAICIAEMLHNTRLQDRDSSVNIPLPPDQHSVGEQKRESSGVMNARQMSRTVWKNDKEVEKVRQ